MSQSEASHSGTDLPSDGQQREQALDLDRSCIVQAPAGSGKTELLTQRMLALLAQVEHPEEVVAITFTRKAAAEMRHRLLSHLSNATGTGGEPGRAPYQRLSHGLALAVLENDARRGWNLLEQPGRLRVRTIDSLCSELARQLPVLSGLGGGQKVTADADTLYHLAATRTMAAIEDKEDPLQADVKRVLNRYDNQYDKLVALLSGMLANREQWLGHLLESRSGEGFDRQALEEALRFLIERQLQTARDLTPHALLHELPRYYHYALGNDPDIKAELNELLQVYGASDSGTLDLPATATALPQWKTLISTLLTKAGTLRKGAPNARDGFPPPNDAKGEQKAERRAMKAGFKALLDDLRENSRLLDIYNTVNSLPSPDYDDEAWESLQSLMHILLRAAENWQVVMAQSGEVDFGELSTRAIQSLGTADAPSELALRLDYRIQHLLVDEFQDTSQSQIRLLEQLTAGWCDGDGRSLFLVGDPMQSIYRFRKAEVSLFIKAWQGQLFEHIQLSPIQLRVNFRSTRAIVDWVNNTFPAIMPRQSDPVMGAVCYSDADTRPQVSDHGTVAIRIMPGRDDEEEARQIVDIIAACDADEKVAILVRSRIHASEILTLLDKTKQDDARFRYQAIKFTPLADTTLVRDLVCLTLALIQPADRLAWLSLLRAPYIGLDLADLDALVAGNSGNIILDVICADQDGLSALSSGGRQRLQRCAPILLQASTRRGRQSTRSLVESTWIALGGPACLDNPSESNDAATYFDLLDALEQQNLPIDHDTLDLRMKKLYAEPDSGANGNLQVLTIYEAKGLQFDRVILPGLNRLPRTGDSKLLHWFELAGENRIVISPMRNSEEKEKQKKSGDLISFIGGIEKQRKKLEDGRLLYVATTRAIHSLYLFAAIKPTVGGDIKAKFGTLLGGLWPAIEAEQIPLIAKAAEELEVANEERLQDDDEPGSHALDLPLIYRRLTANWQLPQRPGPVPAKQNEPAEVLSDIEFNWAGEDARLTGNLVHRLLQVVGEQGIENWQSTGGFSQRNNWCRQQLLSEGVKNAKADGIITRTKTAIENCLSSEQGKWILADHAEARCEYAITAILDGLPKRLVLDRMFISDGICWIIDYKTSSHSGGDLEGFLQNEIARYRPQMQAYSSAIALGETRPVKTALYFPLLDRLCESEDDSEGGTGP